MNAPAKIDVDTSTAEQATSAPRYIYLVHTPIPEARLLFKSYNKDEARVERQRLQSYDGAPLALSYCLDDRVERHLDDLRNPYQAQVTFADRVARASRGSMRNDPDAWYDETCARAAESYVPAGGVA